MPMPPRTSERVLPHPVSYHVPVFTPSELSRFTSQLTQPWDPDEEEEGKGVRLYGSPIVDQYSSSQVWEDRYVRWPWVGPEVTSDSDSDEEEDDEDNSGRPRGPHYNSGRHPDACQVCLRFDQERVLLLCDQCNLAWHTHCLRPRLRVVPRENWYCTQCQNSLVRSAQRANRSSPSRLSRSEWQSQTLENARLMRRTNRATAFIKTECDFTEVFQLLSTFKF